MAQADPVTRALLLNDVLQHVLLYLSKKTLVNYALVHRDSCDAVLNLVWRDLESLIPLLRLIPGFRVVNAQYILTGDPRQWDWTRFEFYAQKVRTLKLLDQSHSLLFIYNCVALVRPTSTPLLPNLISLDYGDISSCRESPLLSLIGPSLERLKITAGAHANLASLLTVLPACAPNIGSISLYDELSNSQGHNSLSSLQYFSNLHELSLMNHGTRISLNFLKELETERFTSISLTFYERQVVVEGQDLSDLRFERLKSLRLDARTRLLKKLTARFDCGKLEDLTLGIRIPDGQGVAHNCAESTLLHSAYQKWSHSLLSLSLALHFSTTSKSTSLQLVTRSLIPPRDTMPRNLKRFQLDVTETRGTVKVVNEGQLEEFIGSLPELEELTLPVCYAVPLSTVQALIPRCPALSKLQLKMDLTSISPTSPLPSLMVNRLHTLSVGESWFPQASSSQKQRLLLWHLFRVFPNLLQVHSTGNSGWREVPEWFALFRAATRVSLDRSRISCT